MKCEKYMNHYLKHGTGKYIPFFVRLHIKRCEKCALEVNRLQRIFTYSGDVHPYLMRHDLSSSIMKAIHILPHYGEYQVSGLKWIATGLFMVGSIFLLPFNDSMQWMRGNFGEAFDLPLTIVMGCAISIYISLFAASHFDMLKLKERLVRVLK